MPSVGIQIVLRNKNMYSSLTKSTFIESTERLVGTNETVWYHFRKSPIYIYVAGPERSAYACASFQIAILRGKIENWWNESSSSHGLGLNSEECPARPNRQTNRAIINISKDSVCVLLRSNRLDQKRNKNVFDLTYDTNGALNWFITVPWMGTDRWSAKINHRSVISTPALQADLWDLVFHALWNRKRIS